VVFGWRLDRAWLVGVLLGVSCGPDHYVCSNDAQCLEGWCESDGYCSFEDAGCPMGRRYGEFSGPNAGRCVGDGPVESSGAGDSTATSTPGGMGSGAATSGGMTEPGSSCSGVCTPAAPAGWSGPVVLRESCESEPAFSGSLDFFGDWSCTCECDLMVDGGCAGGSVELELFDVGDDCDGKLLDVVSIGTSCEPVGVQGLYFQATVTPDASCQATTLSDREPVVPVGEVAGCGVQASGDCGDEVCVDAAPDEYRCIWSAGLRVCPAGSYSSPLVLFQSFEDTRACSDCTCEVGGSCEGDVVVSHEFFDCDPSTKAVSVPLGECSPSTAPNDHAAVVFDSGKQPLSCVDSGGEPVGGLAGSEPITVCCEG
jgi:hypothetical protein